MKKEMKKGKLKKVFTASCRKDCLKRLPERV
jgi:hypothetical protein